MDDVVDRELARALKVAPSPEYVARIRQRIAAEPAPRGVRAWCIAVPGAVILAAAFVIALRPSSSVLRTLNPEPVLRARAIPGMATVSDASGRQPAITAAAARPDVRRPEPPILIDAREANAIRAYLDGISSGRIDRAVAEAGAARDEPPARPLGIEPIVIDPLTPAGLPEGASR